jgi:hypothetical protein
VAAEVKAVQTLLVAMAAVAAALEVIAVVEAQAAHGMSLQGLLALEVVEAAVPGGSKRAEDLDLEAVAAELVFLDKAVMALEVLGFRLMVRLVLAAQESYTAVAAEGVIVQVPAA